MARICPSDITKLALGDAHSPEVETLALLQKSLPNDYAVFHGVCARRPGYGYRRVTQQLTREGKCVNHKRVARIMREHDLQARQPRAFVVTSDGKAPALFSDLAKDCTQNGPDQLWVADLNISRSLSVSCTQR